MRSRGLIRRLERMARGNLERFVLEDGSRYYFDPMREMAELYLHCLDGHLGRDLPEPPELLKAIARARDRRAALEQAAGSFPGGLPYDEDRLVDEGKLVPLPIKPAEDLSEGA